MYVLVVVVRRPLVPAGRVQEPDKIDEYVRSCIRFSTFYYFNVKRVLYGFTSR
jgi:hypothetical protein